jgi:hypothetical protein
MTDPAVLHEANTTVAARLDEETRAAIQRLMAHRIDNDDMDDEPA